MTFSRSLALLTASRAVAGEEALSIRLAPFFTSLYGLKARIGFANNVQTPFAPDDLAIRMPLLCATKRVKYLHG